MIRFEKALFEMTKLAFGTFTPNKINEFPREMNDKNLQITVYNQHKEEEGVVVKNNNINNLTLTHDKYNLRQKDLNHQKFLLVHNLKAFNSWQQEQDFLFNTKMKRELNLQNQNMQMFLKNQKENRVSNKILLMSGGTATLDESLKILEGDYIPQNYHSKMIIETSLVSIVVGFILYALQNVKIMGHTLNGHIRQFIPEAILKPMDKVFANISAAKSKILAYTCALELILLVDLISHYVGEINMSDMYRQTLKDVIKMTGESYEELLKVHVDDVTKFATKLEECNKDLQELKKSSNL